MVRKKTVTGFLKKEFTRVGRTAIAPTRRRRAEVAKERRRLVGVQTKARRQERTSFFKKRARTVERARLRRSFAPIVLSREERMILDRNVRGERSLNQARINNDRMEQIGQRTLRSMEDQAAPRRIFGNFEHPGGRGWEN